MMRGRVRRHRQRTFFGIVPGTRRGVGVDLEARLRGTYLVGQTGVGKSSLILGLACQDLRAGRGLCVLDPNGDLIDDLIARVSGFGREDDVLLLDLQAGDVAFGLNLFSCADPSDPQAVAQTAERVVGIFKKLWGGDSWGPRMQDLLGNAALTLVANPGTTLADLPRLLTDADYRHGLTRHLTATNPIVAGYWQREYDPLSDAARHQVYAPVTNKVREFLRNPLLHAIVAQPTSSVDFVAAIAARKIVLVRLDPAMTEATDLLGTVIIHQLQEAIFARRHLPPASRTPFMLYADEAHRFATPAFITLLREARKYGLATTAATQMHALLPADVATAFTNSATVACFQLVPEDARALQMLFTGATIPRPFVPDPTPLATLLRAGAADHRLLESAMAVERALLRYQEGFDVRQRRARQQGDDSLPVSPHVRRVRLLIDELLVAAMAGAGRDAWAEFAATTNEAPGLRRAVSELAERLEHTPLALERAERIDVPRFLTRLPAFQALVRYRDGMRIDEALIRTLPTRPLGPPVVIRALGIPRASITPVHEIDPPPVPVVLPAASGAPRRRTVVPANEVADQLGG